MGGSKRKYDPICCVAECGRPHHSRGYCQGHLARIARGLDPHTGPPLGAGKFKYLGQLCEADGCGEDARIKKMCEFHWRRSHFGRSLSTPYGATDYGKLWKPIKYITAHARCFRLWGPAKGYPCIECGKPAQQWAYDGTDPTELYERCGSGLQPERRARYSRFPEFYMPMCARCHRRADGAQASAELTEYREWKHRTGLTLADLETGILKGIFDAAMRNTA